MLDAICVVNEEGVFLSVAGACERIFRYAPEELIGRQMLDLVYEPDRKKTLGAVARLMGGQLQYDFENRYVRKDGRIAYLMWSARWYSEKKIRVAVARDITDRKRKIGTTDAKLPAMGTSWQLSAAPRCLIPPESAPIMLSDQDYVVLAVRAANSAVVTRRQIIEALGQDYLSYDRRRLDTQIRRLRRKVEEASGLPLPITSVRGVGFRLYAPVDLK